MNFYFVFFLVVLFVFCKFYCLDGLDLSPEQIAEVRMLKIVTEKFEESNQSFVIPQDLLEYDDYDITFNVYTQSHSSGTILYYDESNLLSSIPGFSTDLRTVIIIHGWQASGISVVRDVLLADASVNIVSVNWSTYSYNLYISAVSSVPKVGKTVGKFIKGMYTNYDYSVDQIILIGHSLGAHVSGFAGKYLNGQVGVIIGIDPAGPLYFKISPGSRLNSRDALYVQAIHTNARLLGVNFDLADADFWPNGGYIQSGCTGILINSCSHSISNIYMAESISDNQFYARECNIYPNYLNGNCATNNVALMGGLVYDILTTGVFFLNTSSTSPYALGDIFASDINYLN